MIALNGRPALLEGWAHGLPQRPLTGQLTLTLPAKFDFVRWQTRFRAGVEAVHAAAPVDWLAQHRASSADESVLATVLHAVQAVLRSLRIPVHSGFRLWRSHPPAGAGADRPIWSYAIPVVYPLGSEGVLHWLVDIANHAMGPDPMPEGPLAAYAGAGMTSPAWVSKGTAMLEQLKPLAAPGVNIFPLITAALDLGIQARSLTGRFLTLGVGDQARLFDSTLTDRTPSIGVQLARSKLMCAEVLRAAGLPVPEQRLARSVEDAMKAVERLGFPLVVKPADLDRGEGVAADLRSAEAVREAFSRAIALSREVLIERHIVGATHRLTVWDGRLIRVTRRVTAGVTGDGQSTVEQLVERLREDPTQLRRAARMGKPLIELDAEAHSMLGQQGLTVRSVPAAGRRVRLRRRDNVNAGGTNEQIALETVHPDNVLLALRAARILRLDIAGIDFITEDITRSWMDAGGGICEVNAQPQIGISDTPDLYHRMLREAMPRLGRIPIVIHAVADAGLAPALDDDHAVYNARAARDRVVIEGQTVSVGHRSAFAAIRCALHDPAVRGLQAVVPIDELLTTGLPACWVDRIVVHASPVTALAQTGSTVARLREQFAGNVGEVTVAP